MSFEGSALAKIILFGEHAVVYGKPAIAVPISSLRAKVSITPATQGEGIHIFAADLKQTFSVQALQPLSENPLELTTQLVLDRLESFIPDLNITVQSEIPLASGLGSGAAVATALARGLAQALSCKLENAVLNGIIYEIEKLHHGTPSGIDNTVIAYEKPVYFVRDQPIETLKIHTPFRLIIGDTGISASTRAAVADVRKLFEADPVSVQPVLDDIGLIAQQARRSVESGSLSNLGALMNQNHEVLQRLTVSSPELDNLVYTAREAGANGAKLSGGGRGGNMIALVDNENAAKVREKLLRAGAVHVFETVVG